MTTMDTTLLHGRHVMLRAPEPEDIDMLYLLENDADICRHSLTGSPVSRHQLWNYLHNYTGDLSADGQLRLVIVEKSGAKAIGTVDITDYSRADARAMVGIGLMREYRRQGYGGEALALIGAYAADALRLHQLWAVVAADNAPSISLFRHAGYRPCGKLRSWQRRGKSYADAIIFQHLFE